MKTRFFSSIIFTAVLASSAAQAGTQLSIEETYSGVLSSIARDDDGQGSYYVAIKPQSVASITNAVILASSAAEASTGLSIEERYSGVLPSVARDDDGQGSYYVEIKPQPVASISSAATVASSAAQAGTELSIEERYSGVLPSIIRDDYGLGSYYVETKPQVACTQYDLDPLSVIYPEQRDSLSDYLGPQSAHVVCLRNTSRG